MINTLENLCRLNGTSGNEESIREYILSEIKDCAETHVDALGNIIAFKKGKKSPDKKIMIDAHMDEVGIIVKSITPDGFLKFSTVGGIKTSVLLCRKTVFENGVCGVICLKPIHLLSKEEAAKLPNTDALYIDIGAADRKEAESIISIGAYGVIDGPFTQSGNIIKSKAIDDRAGCAVLIDMLKNDAEYDFYATFTVQEEIGARGAKTAAYDVDPDFCIVLESTTANDISGVGNDKSVCKLGEGAVVSFMDSGTMYDRHLYDIAMSSGIKCQPKSAVAGGNNSGSIHLTRSGVRTLALSVPCRYIHSPACVADLRDIVSVRDMAEYMLCEMGKMQ